MIKHRKTLFAGDLNINVLDYESNKKVQHFLSSMFQYNMIPTINKPNRVTRNTAPAIDHIITNTVISGIQHRSGIIKTDVSDHFPIVFALNTCEKSKPEDKAQCIYKRIYEEEQIELFKHELSHIEWNKIIKTLYNPNTAYESFFDILFKTYDKYFPKVRIKIKAKTIQNPWITKGITKSSRKKQKLYERFLKKHTQQNEQKYKNYKNLFETIKKKAKKIYYSKTWNVMKDIIGKSKIKKTNLPRKLTINKVDVYNKPEIADAFNDFFTNIGQKLASQLPKLSKTFETYMNKVNVLMDSKPLSLNELKEAFFSLKINKSSGVDDVSFNIIKKWFGVLCELLTYLFQLSLEKGYFQMT